MIHRTKPDRAALPPDGWQRFGDLWIAGPLVDLDRPGLYARLTYADAMAAATRLGGRLMTQAEIDRALAGQSSPCLIMPPGPEMGSVAYSTAHDRKLQSLPAPRRNHKHWVLGAPAGRSWNYGLKRTSGTLSAGPVASDGTCTWTPMKPAAGVWQNLGAAHDDEHTDYSQLTTIVRDTPPDAGTPETELDTEQQETPPVTTPIYRPTLRIGDKNEHVGAWQLIVGARVDNDFGPKTEAKTEEWQRRHGLVDDGVVGRKSWSAAGYQHVSEAPGQAPTRSAKAAFSILRDANAAWPKRRRTSDGVWGDARHQASKSDHNDGLACDLSHDPRNGCDGAVVAELAIHDDRVTYVIFNARIYNRARAAEGWRKYTGSNPHTSHVHISLREESRDDDRPWPWAPGQAPP